MMFRLRFLLMVISLDCLAGCGSATVPAEGGTSGTLKFGADAISDIVVTVHQGNSGQLIPIGFGTTMQDGSFFLYQTGATGPSWLEPGDYVFTRESIGRPVQFPDEFLEPGATPLKFTWTADMKSADSEAPHELIVPGASSTSQVQEIPASIPAASRTTGSCRYR